MKAPWGMELPSFSCCQKSSSVIVGYHATLYSSPSLGIPPHPKSSARIYLANPPAKRIIALCQTIRIFQAEQRSLGKPSTCWLGLHKARKPACSYRGGNQSQSTHGSPCRDFLHFSCCHLHLGYLSALRFLLRATIRLRCLERLGGYRLRIWAQLPLLSYSECRASSKRACRTGEAI